MERYLNFIARCYDDDHPLYYENDDGCETYLLIYGTLRKGMPNSWLMDGLLELGHAVYRGKASAECLFSMEVGGLPAAYISQGDRPNVELIGELYLVSYAALDILDLFEGHPNYYCKETIGVWCYENAHGEEMDRRHYAAYCYMGPTILKDVPSPIMHAALPEGEQAEPVRFDYCEPHQEWSGCTVTSTTRRRVNRPSHNIVLHEGAQQ